MRKIAIDNLFWLPWSSNAATNSLDVDWDNGLRRELVVRSADYVLVHCAFEAAISNIH